MAIEKIYLDPTATSYTDDQIVGKVNAATAKVVVEYDDACAEHGTHERDKRRKIKRDGAPAKGPGIGPEDPLGDLGRLGAEARFMNLRIRPPHQRLEIGVDARLGGEGRNLR